MIREVLEEDIFGELFDRQNVDEEGIALEPLNWDGFENFFGVDDGSGEQDHVRVLFAEVMRVGVK